MKRHDRTRRARPSEAHDSTATHLRSHGAAPRAPRSVTAALPDEVLALQRTLGNRAVRGLLAPPRAKVMTPADELADATSGAASPLPYRREMERAFGEDFSSVEAHLGRAAEMKALGAHAAAAGETIAFASPSPSKSLVAHELTHVVQSRRSGVAPLAKSSAVGDAGGAAEREADLVAHRIAAGATLPVIRAVPDGGIHLAVDPSLPRQTRVKRGERTGTIESEDTSRGGYVVAWGNDNDNNASTFVSYEDLDLSPSEEGRPPRVFTGLNGWRTTLKRTVGQPDEPRRIEAPAEKHDVDVDADLAAYNPRFGETPASPLPGLIPMYPVVARREHERNDYERQPLARDKEDGKYVYEGMFGPQEVDKGNYQFAIRWSAPHEVLFGHTGHINVGNTGPVVYAGTLYFTADGVLGYWNNNTGHYKCSPRLASQASTVKSDFNGEPVLPLGKFQSYRRS
ncbi:Hypothetical protein A7982_11695 [Minicystis rosea]|nr:Hypothetical protein A7982_11695 [Minicystis rosea]